MEQKSTTNRKTDIFNLVHIPLYIKILRIISCRTVLLIYSASEVVELIGLQTADVYSMRADGLQNPFLGIACSITKVFRDELNRYSSISQSRTCLRAGH